MNNEPVAWMYKDEEGGMVSFIKDTLPFDAVPLYTHQYERPHNTVLVPCDKLAEMQAEIDALKKEAALQRLSDFTQEAECEPVAWAYILDGDFWDAIHPDEHAQEEGSYTIPLYTHPVNVTYELTMEKCRQQQAKIEALKQVLGRYVKEVPLGNQPHMLAHIALELVNG